MFGKSRLYCNSIKFLILNFGDDLHAVCLRGYAYADINHEYKRACVVTRCL